MDRPKILRPLIGLTGLAASLLWRAPAAPAPAPIPAAPIPGASSIVTHQDMQGRVLLYGTLVALHPAARTGDLALPDGTLLPLRFTLADQMRGLRVGDELAVDAEGHGHGRLLVRMVARGELSKHWRGDDYSKHWRGEDWSKHWRTQDFSKHWRNGDYSKHWRIRGVVARTLGHGDVEVLGVDGAASLLHVAGAGVTGAPDGATPRAGAAYAEGGPAVVPGMVIDARVTPAGGGATLATTVWIVATRAVGMDVEGQVAAVDRASGALTIVDENGLPTRIALGARTAGYGVGQSVEAWGQFGDAPGVPDTLALSSDTTAEHEDADAAGTLDLVGRNGTGGMPVAATPATIATPAFVIPVRTSTSAIGAGDDPTATPTPAFVIPVAATSSPAPTPAFVISVASTPTTGAASATSTASATPTGTATDDEGGRSTSTPTAAPPAVATATPLATRAVATPTMGIATPGAEDTKTAMPTATGAAAVSATATDTASSPWTPTSTATPAPTLTAMPTSTSTPGDTQASTATATATATAMPILTTQQSCAATATAIAAGPAPATATAVPTNTPDASGVSLRVRYQVAAGDQACGTLLQPKLKVYNDGSASVPLSELTLRYYIDHDGGPTPPWFPTTTNGWTLTIYPAPTPAPGADTYLEYTYSGSGAVNPGGSVDVPPITVCKPVVSGSCAGSLSWNQYNDYSYDGTVQGYRDWDKVALYDNGALIWGREPR